MDNGASFVSLQNAAASLPAATSAVFTASPSKSSARYVVGCVLKSDADAKQIMCYLEPIDLLRLAGTCHYFRNTLMRRSAKFIWVSARQHVRGHLPDCPHWLSEPAFARLAFARECHVSSLC